MEKFGQLVQHAVQSDKKSKSREFDFVYHLSYSVLNRWIFSRVVISVYFSGYPWFSKFSLLFKENLEIISSRE